MTTSYDRFLLGYTQAEKEKHNPAEEAWKLTKRPSTIGFVISTTFSAYLLDLITHSKNNDAQKRKITYFVLGLNTVVTTYFYNLMNIERG